VGKVRKTDVAKSFTAHCLLINEGLQDILLNVKKSRNSTQILIILAAIFFSILLFGCMLGRITKNAKYQQLKTK